MENTAKFDLNESISAWRRQLRESPALRNDDLEELEAHLRDSIARWQSAGLSPEEAFWIAKRRIGNDESLACEFGKVNSERVWLTRALWVVGGSLTIKVFLDAASMISFLGAMAAQRMMQAGYDFGLVQWAGRTLSAQPGNVNGVALGLATIAAYLITLAALGWLVWRSLRGSRGLLSRAGQWMQAHPVWATIAVAMIVLCSSACGMGIHFLGMRRMAISDYSTILMCRTYTFLGSILAWPLLLGWLLARWSRQLGARA